jgi:hypothetical protein
MAAMEDVIEVYHRAHHPDPPVVCLDETSKQLIVETRMPIPAKPGQPRQIDYEYARNGTANLFMLFAPLEGWRHVKMTDRHAAVDYAQVLKELSDTHFPEASKIVLVQDNLSTHKPASLSQAFPARQACYLVERFAWHFTPNRRIPNKHNLITEVAAWQNDRNKKHAKAECQFTTAEARIKLKRLYPTL